MVTNAEYVEKVLNDFRRLINGLPENFSNVDLTAIKVAIDSTHNSNVTIAYAVGNFYMQWGATRYVYIKGNDYVGKL